MMNAQPKCNRCGQPGYTHGNYSDCITYLKTRVALADSEAVAGTNRAERAEAECDNLRARVAELEAGQGWRPVDDLDLDRDIEAEIMMRATFQHEYGAWDARSINILRSDVDFWRPAPPQ